MQQNLNIVNQLNQPLRFIISGGGTGGHIFPAISIANAIKAVRPNTELLFVGALGRMEMQKVPDAGFNIVGLPVSGFNRQHKLKNIMVIFKLIISLIKAKAILRKFKPHAVIGVGGYASGPVMFMAAKMKIPVFIQEQNSYAGVTNKMVAKHAKVIFVAYENMWKYFPSEKIIIAGNPVRKGLEGLKDKKSEGLAFFGIEPGKKVVLLVGGSLGARTLNKCIAAALNKVGNSNMVLIWQCGAYYFNEAQKQLAQSGVQNVMLFDFIGRMDMAYAAADIIISRAGAGTISELCIVGKPVILVPSPNVAEDHQTKNANALAKSNAAVVISDAEAPQKLIHQIFSLIENEDMQNKLSGNITKLALYNAAENITTEILRNVEC